MDVFMGTIMTFGFNYAPYQWALCNGQTIAISQNAALFSLLGTYYGGNGTSTFQLPNLQGRMPIAQGTGAGLSTRVIGEVSGTENASILISNMPAHTHVATFTPAGGGGYQVSTNVAGNVEVPTATKNILSGSPTGQQTAAAIWGSVAGTIPLGGGSASGGTVTNALTGNSLPLSIMNPFLVLNFSIALYGIFPTRN